MRGYTLIELLIVISIMGLIIVGGYAGFRDFSRRQALTGQARMVEADLRQAQQKALAGDKGGCSGVLAGYQFAVSGSSYSVTPVCSVANGLAKDVPLSAGYTLALAPPVSGILFKVLGQGTNLAAGAVEQVIVTQTATGKQTKIRVTAAGEITNPVP